MLHIGQYRSGQRTWKKSTYTEGIEVRLGVELDTLVGLEFLKENLVHVQGSIRHNGYVLQSHRSIDRLHDSKHRYKRTTTDEGDVSALSDD